NQNSTTANVTAKALTATASASNKVYNGNNTATTTLTFSGLIGSETLGQTVGSTFNNKNVGTSKTVTVNSITLSNGSNGGLGANYSISPGQTTNANVTAKSLTVSGITASNKTYDGNSNATVNLSLSGFVGSETLNVTNISSFPNKNVETGKTATVNSITLTDGTNGGLASNYSINPGQTVTATIIAKSLIVSGITSSNRTYDTTSSAILDTSSVAYNGLIPGDDFTGSFSGLFVNENVAQGKQINITSTYSGNDVINYNITNQGTSYSDILIANPTINGLSNQSKNFRELIYASGGVSSISGLPIIYTSSDPSVATVNSSTGNVTFLNVGSTTITANIISTLNYNSAISSYTLEIKLNATNVDRISHDTIRSSNRLSKIENSSSIGNSNGGLNNMPKSRILNGGENTPIKAKVVISSDGQNLTVEGIYDDGDNLGEISKEFNDEEEKERFEEPGDIIDKRNIVLSISEGDFYNYQLELRNKGLVIKALDNSSVSFIETNKGLVIKSAISEVMGIVGFVKSQLKTIIIDLKEKF
ncbi:MAG: hypothetical protein CMN44_02375, partial [SAR116 cluster bacterium]|nr:hypothetical protein [SAR116 cluster bacterium]